MSDDGVINVEEDGPAVDPVAEVPAAEPVVEAATETPEDTAAEVDAVEVAGKKYVPVGAVIAERKQRQALQEKANKADELERYVNDSRPYVEFLKANPSLMQRQAPPAPTTFGAPAPDPEAVALAQQLDLYTPDGKPDVERAAGFLALVDRKAQRIVQQSMAPMHEQTFQDKSARNYQIALTVKDAQGRTPSPAALTQIWRTMSAEQTADPHVASILALTALGLDSVSQKPVIAPPGSAPLVTEGAGVAGRRPALSTLEANLARDRGITEAKWQDNTKGFQPGRSNQLED